MNKIFSISIFLLLVTFNFAKSQCNGSLGENILLDGDFGSGVSHILQTDPQLAPGYQYQTNPPPDDGFYTINNNFPFKLCKHFSFSLNYRVIEILNKSQF